MRKAVTILLLAASMSTAHAQSGDVDLDRGPTADLYIRKRPPAPDSPALSPELQKMLMDAQEQRDAKREEAIKLLRAFLAGKPEGETRAQGLFKLAELLWEDARRLFLERVDAFERAEERCKQRRCKKAPKEPKIDLSESEELYRTLLTDHPDFPRRDLVLYLVGFAAKQDGREDQAIGMFEQVIKDFPDSPLYGDSWMMIGEHYFAAEHWPEARKAYAQILPHKEAATYELALFKTAWCDWKLGDIELATSELKELLGTTINEEGSGSKTQQRQRIDIRDEALEYLVLIFVEDRTITPKDVYEFLASVGGEKYSRDVLVEVAEAYFGQSEYEKSADAYHFLIGLDPDSLSAARYQRKILENFVSALDNERSRQEMKTLVDGYGPKSAWARHLRGEQEALAKSISVTEKLARTTADNLNAEAQSAEKRNKGKADKKLYQNAAEAYLVYLDGFGDEPEAVEVRYHLGDIYFFTLEDWEAAGDQYLAVGKSAPVGELHKPALKQAMDAFEKARPKDTAGRNQMYPVDKKFGEAMDLYATLFHDDKEVVGLIFKYGELFYDYGDYDEAIKRFGLIVEEYPDDPNALAAGDRILKALQQGKDYENIETWARRLKKTKAFKDPKEQATLDSYIVEAIRKSGDKYAEAGKYEQAAGFYLRIPKEFPKHPEAAQLMRNAGVQYVKAKKPEEAAEIYLDLAERYPKSDKAAASAFDAAQLYESVAYFDRAAEAYELYYDKFPKATDAAVALYNAGRLRQSLGQYDKAIAHYQTYAKKFKSDSDADAASVAFKIGVVYEESGDDGRADQAYRSFIKTHKGDKRLIEAYVRAGRASFRLGQLKRAGESFEEALKLHKKSGGEKTKMWAAEAKYWQGELLYRDYEKVSLDVKPSALDRTLKKKTDMLLKAREVYLGVVPFKDFRWATAALYRIGNVFEQYATSLRQAPTPKDLTDDEAEAYRGALDMAVLDIEEQAITYYTTGYQKAIELQLYDSNTSKIREALGRMAPDQYPPEREGRADERVGDRPIELKLIRELNR